LKFKVPDYRGIHGDVFLDQCLVVGLADGELVWTSFDKVVKQYTKRSETFNRIHPVQKPTSLYKWLLKNYATPDMKILSTHVGSASDLIAFEDFGCEYRGYEIDRDYYEAAKKRLKQHTDQLTIFNQH